MDWHKLYFGKVTAEEVRESVHDDLWQLLRKSLKGKTLEQKYEELTNYVKSYLVDESVIEKFPKDDQLKLIEHNRKVKVRVTNYVTALSRAGLILPEDYRSTHTPSHTHHIKINP